MHLFTQTAKECHPPVSDGLQVSGPLSLDPHFPHTSQVAVVTVSRHVCQVSVAVDRGDPNVTA